MLLSTSLFGACSSYASWLEKPGNPSKPRNPPPNIKFANNLKECWELIIKSIPEKSLVWFKY